MEWGSSKSRSIGGFGIGQTMSLRKSIVRIIAAARCYFNVFIVHQHLFMRDSAQMGYEFLHNVCYSILSHLVNSVCQRLGYLYLPFNCSSIHLAIQIVPGQRNMHIFVSVKVGFETIFPHIPFYYPLNNSFPLLLYFLISLHSLFYRFIRFYFHLLFHNSFTLNFHSFFDYF